MTIGMACKFCEFSSAKGYRCTGYCQKHATQLGSVSELNEVDEWFKKLTEEAKQEIIDQIRAQSQTRGWVKVDRSDLRVLLEEIDSLRKIRDQINSPMINDWIGGVRNEVGFQRKWTDYDSKKSNIDWFWLIGYLAGKALAAADTDVDLAKHHTISTGAALYMWFTHLNQKDSHDKETTSQEAETRQGPDR